MKNTAGLAKSVASATPQARDCRLCAARSRRTSRRLATIDRPLFGGLAVVAACLMITLAVRGSEPVDSGWNLAKPSASLGGVRAPNQQVRIAINYVLAQSEVPLLQSPAQLRPAFRDASDDGPEFAEAADGWRPVHLSGEPTNRESILIATPTALRFKPATSNAPLATATDKQEATIDTVSEAASQPVGRAKSNDDADEEEFESEATESGSHQRVIIQDEKAQPKKAAADAPPAVEVPAPEPLPPLSQQMKNLRAKVRRVLKSYYNRPLNSRENDPWECMHGMLAYGVHSQIRQGSPRGQTITLVGWLCFNRPCKGFTLLYTTPENELRVKQGVGLQGHMGQFLAMLAQSQVSPEYPIRIRDQEFTINDLIEAEKKTCYTKTELTFKLIALMHYLDSDATWVNDQGQSWDIPRLIREELAQPIRGAACGGTHRLSGLSLAARTRVRRDEPLDGEYLRAAQYIEKYQQYAFQLQNRDGSLSTEWFRGRGQESDIDRRVKTTGHILEWLVYSLNDKDVKSTRTFRAVNYLASLLSSNFDHEWEVGPQSHAIHALRLYDERVFQPYDGEAAVAKNAVRKTANRSSSSSRSSSKQY
jgi:hypothetical protein